MSVTHVGGVDPGLVHTGVVSMAFFPNRREIHVEHTAVLGLDEAEVRDFLNLKLVKRHHRFIEGYRPRSNLNNDRRMQAAVTSIRAATGGRVLDNMGVKKVVRKPLMELLGVWSFPTKTHHQDLRSAARIALLGMLKDDDLNRLLADVVRDHLKGDDWNVAHG